MTPTEQFEKTYRKPREGRTLIVGSRVYEDQGREDRRALYADAVGVDAIDGPGVDLVLNLEEELPDGQFDHVECRSVLEHSPRPWLLAANIERLIVPRGTLDLSVPFVWSLHAYPSDFFRFTAEGVRSLFQNIDWTALMYANGALSEGGKTPRSAINGQIYIARTEVLGWGERL